MSKKKPDKVAEAHSALEAAKKLVEQAQTRAQHLEWAQATLSKFEPWQLAALTEILMTDHVCEYDE